MWRYYVNTPFPITHPVLGIPYQNPVPRFLENLEYRCSRSTGVLLLFFSSFSGDITKSPGKDYERFNSEIRFRIYQRKGVVMKELGVRRTTENFDSMSPDPENKGVPIDSNFQRSQSRIIGNRG